MEGVVDLERDDMRARISYRRFPQVEPGTQVDLITFDDVDYFRPVGSRRWVETATSADDVVANALDVPSSLGSLAAVTGEVRVLGRERVRGVETTRYAAKIETARVADTLPRAQAERYRERAAALPDEIPVEIWVGVADRRIRKMHFDVSIDRPGIVPGETRFVADLELRDFGVPARVERPPARLTVRE